MNPILHITELEQWQAGLAAGKYQVKSLETEGFIHCSTPAQVLKPANEMFHGQTGLALLVIDPARVKADIVYEDCYESGIAFPHIYGALNIDAVTLVVDFPPNEDGSFTLPPALQADIP